MRLIDKILTYLQGRTEPVTMQEIYEAVPGEKQTTVRGRVYDSLGIHLERKDRGLYVIIGAATVNIVEEGDSRKLVFSIIQARLSYDFLLMDIPYLSGGQKGGNRNLSDYPTIPPKDFWKLCKRLPDLMRTAESQMYFMISNGQCTESAAAWYKACIENEFKLAGQGEYLKTYANGSPCKIGQHVIPSEGIYAYSLDGTLRKCSDDFTLNFTEVRPNGYPTQKPYNMIKQFIHQATRLGEMCLDLFAGSGQMHHACVELARSSHSIDISPTAIQTILR